MGTIIITEDAQVHIVEAKPAIKVERGKHYRTTRECTLSFHNEPKKLLARENEIVTCIEVISEEIGWERSLFRTELGTAVLWHNTLKAY